MKKLLKVILLSLFLTAFCVLFIIVFNGIVELGMEPEVIVLFAIPIFFIILTNVGGHYY